jgi:hypothetical protein
MGEGRRKIKTYITDREWEGVRKEGYEGGCAVKRSVCLVKKDNK